MSTLDGGQSVGRYRIVRFLGAGAMGEVYLAEDPHIERRLAIKTVRLAGGRPQDIEDRKKRLLREARAAGRLLHPNVVTLFDTGEVDGLLYLAFEFVEGADLASRIEEGPPPSLGEVLRIVHQVAEALDYAHRQGIVHRDIKPSNILIDTTGKVKVADFGIAKVAGQNTELTVVGSVMGSPQYLSPEQIRGDELDGRSDIFSLGVVLYELLSGRRPFDGETITTLVYQILHKDPSISEMRAVPLRLDQLLHRMLAKDRDARLAIAGLVAEEVAAVRRELSEEALAAPAASVTQELDATRVLPARSTPSIQSAPALPPAAGAPPPPLSTLPAGLPPAPAPPAAARGRRGMRIALAAVVLAVVLMACAVTAGFWLLRRVGQRFGTAGAGPVTTAQSPAAVSSPPALRATAPAPPPPQPPVAAGVEKAAPAVPAGRGAAGVSPSAPSAVAGSTSRAPTGVSPAGALPAGTPATKDKSTSGASAAPNIVSGSAAGRGAAHLTAPPHETSAARPEPKKPAAPPPVKEAQPQVAAPGGSALRDRAPGNAVAVKAQKSEPVETPARPVPPVEAAVKPPAQTETLASPAPQAAEADQYLRTNLELAFRITPPDAFVLLDGAVIGQAQEWSGLKGKRPFTLPGPGPHVIKLKKSGMRDYRIAVEATATRGTTPVVVRLQPLPAADVETPDLDKVQVREAVAFNVKPDAAMVLVDGQAVGQAKRFGGGFGHSGSWLPLPPGTHRITLIAPGYRRHDIAVEVTGGADKARQRIDVTLTLGAGRE
ncbi:MAG TPA: protein kinase [Thermoanaerobaculia bacterium]|nr:protein kinase [Thermoanaerobaculia bacterium]